MYLVAVEKTSLAGRWVCEDWAVKACCGQTGASQDVGPAPPISQPHPYCFLWGVNIPGGNLRGVGRLCFL